MPEPNNDGHPPWLVSHREDRSRGRPPKRGMGGSTSGRQQAAWPLLTPLSTTASVAILHPTIETRTDRLRRAIKLAPLIVGIRAMSGMSAAGGPYMARIPTIIRAIYITRRDGAACAGLRTHGPSWEPDLKRGLQGAMGGWSRGQSANAKPLTDARAAGHEGLCVHRPWTMPGWSCTAAYAAKASKPERFRWTKNMRRPM